MKYTLYNLMDLSMMFKISKLFMIAKRLVSNNSGK